MAARLLFIEDDASIARFVSLALHELPRHDPAAPAVDLHHVGTLAQAREALAAGDWQLVISDLMLPDGSAETLLAEGFALAEGAPPWVVFSAGVDADGQAALAARGVARTLHKPVPLTQLLDTVAALLQGQARAAPVPAEAVVDDTALNDSVQRHFGGDRVLYETFRQGCIERFADDLHQGDAAHAGHDAAALRRVAHGLKAVLTLIGAAPLAARAGALEGACEGWVPGQAWPAGWPGLASGLLGLGASRRA